MTSDRRIVIYSQDGMGLGHLRRNTLIGQQILEAASNGNILLIADSQLGRSVEGTSDYSVQTWGISPQERLIGGEGEFA